MEGGSGNKVNYGLQLVIKIRKQSLPWCTTVMIEDQHLRNVTVY